MARYERQLVANKATQSPIPVGSVGCRVMSIESYIYIYYYYYIISI